MSRSKPMFGECDSYQLEPFAFPEAWDRYKNMRKNEWTPEEIPVAPDVAHYRDQNTPIQITSSFLSVMAQLTTFDMERGMDAAETFLQIVQPPEIKMALTRMIFEEAGHTQSYRYIIENFGLPISGPDNFYDTWKWSPEMKDRVEHAQFMSDRLMHLYKPNNINTRFVQEFLRATHFWFQQFEGMWFWINLLGPVQQMSELGYYEGAAEQFRLIARDETQHIALGVDIWNWVLEEYPEAMDEYLIQTIQEDVEKAVQLEERFVHFVFREGPILGYPVQDHIETTKWFANHRLRTAGLPAIYDNPQHPLHALFALKMEIKQEGNFFEKRVKEYQTGAGLSFEEADGYDPFESVMSSNEESHWPDSLERR